MKNQNRRNQEIKKAYKKLKSSRKVGKMFKLHYSTILNIIKK